MTSPIVTIPGCGRVRGAFQPENASAVASFLNIPFATVPERWRASIKAQAWAGIRDATKVGPMCHQPKSENPLVSMTSGYDEEDEGNAVDPFDEVNCLNLNIWVPTAHLASNVAPSADGIPIMVWVHGGSFKDGGNAMPLYDGTNFVLQSIKMGRPVMLVSINYRLNFFGFLSSKELAQEVAQDSRLTTEAERSIGNWGLLDQKLAFEWIRDHGRSFGGNPKDITAFGESAGASSIAYLMMSPVTRGLFSKAILQSGAATMMHAGRIEFEGQRYFDNLCRHFKIPLETTSSEEKMKRLRAIPAQELVKAADKGKVGMFLPTIDGYVIPFDARHWVHDPTAYDPNLKAVMLGDCRDEGTMFAGFLGAKTMTRWAKFKARHCAPGQEAEFDAIYGIPKTDKEALQLSVRILTDQTFLHPIYTTSRALLNRQGLDQDRGQKDGVLVSRYHFDRSLEVVDGFGLGLGAHHAAELPFLFSPPSYVEMMTEKEQELGRQVMAVWIWFAYGETQTRLSRVQNVLASDVGVGIKEALVFTEHCTVEKGQVERLNARTLEYWDQTEKWVAKKRTPKSGQTKL